MYPGGGWVGAFRSWWNLYDKGTVLDAAAERSAKTSESVETTRLKNRKEVEQLHSEQLKLNEEIQILSRRASELLKQQGNDEELKRLLAEADDKTKQSILCSQRRAKAGKLSMIFRRQASLITEDKEKLASWIEVVANSRARALNRLLGQLGSLLGTILVVLVIAHFAEKNPPAVCERREECLLLSQTDQLCLLAHRYYHSDL